MFLAVRHVADEGTEGASAVDEPLADLVAWHGNDFYESEIS